MNSKKLSNQVSVSPQIVPSDLAEIERRCFKSVIGNRLDGGGVDQPVFAEVEIAANTPNAKTPSRTAWLLKECSLPPIYWQAMLKGRAWMARPKVMS